MAAENEAIAREEAEQARVAQEEAARRTAEAEAAEAEAIAVAKANAQIAAQVCVLCSVVDVCSPKFQF